MVVASRQPFPSLLGCLATRKHTADSTPSRPSRHRSNTITTARTMMAVLAVGRVVGFGGVKVGVGRGEGSVEVTAAGIGEAIG